jgi:uncharacterized membrane protein
MSAARVHHAFLWLGESPIGHAMRVGLLPVPIAAIAHLVGLALLGGSTLLVSFSVWGVVVRQPTATRVAKELWPFALGGLALTIVTGVLLVSANAQYYYDNTVFWVKLALLIPATAVSLILHRHLRRAGEAPATLRWKVVGAANLLLWTSVAVAGRAIGLL